MWGSDKCWWDAPKHRCVARHNRVNTIRASGLVRRSHSTAGTHPTAEPNPGAQGFVAAQGHCVKAAQERGTIQGAAGARVPRGTCSMSLAPESPCLCPSGRLASRCPPVNVQLGRVQRRAFGAFGAVAYRHHPVPSACYSSVSSCLLLSRSSTGLIIVSRFGRLSPGSMATTSSTTPLSFNDSPFGFYGHPSGTERQAHTSNNDQQRYLTMSTVPSSHSSAQAPMQSSHQQQQASPYSQSPSWNTNQLHGFFGTGLFDQTQQQPQQAYYLQRQTPSQPTQHSSLLPPYLVDSPMEQSSTNHPATSSYAQSEDSVQSSPNAVNPQNQFSTPLPTNATGPSQQDADVSTLDFDQEASGSDSARSPTPAATQAAQGAKWGPKAKRKSNPHFVTKLFYMLEGGAWDHVVRWSFNGDSFIVVVRTIQTCSFAL